MSRTVLYLVKEGDDNEELRFSLRSLRHLPHDRVVFVGALPSWVQSVDHIPGNRYSSKWSNVFDNLLLAARALDDFVVMNDDIFLMEPMTTVPSWFRGYLVDHIRKIRVGPWRTSLEATLRVLRQRGFAQPLSYEIHAPVEMNGPRLLDVLAPHAGEEHPPQWRTLYGNIYGVEATQVRDMKVMRTTMQFDKTKPVLSSDDPSFRYAEIGRLVRDRFPRPSPYEAPLTVAAGRS